MKHYERRPVKFDTSYKKKQVTMAGLASRSLHMIAQGQTIFSIMVKRLKKALNDEYFRNIVILGDTDQSSGILYANNKQYKIISSHIFPNANHVFIFKPFNILGNDKIYNCTIVLNTVANVKDFGKGVFYADAWREYQSDQKHLIILNVFVPQLLPDNKFNDESIKYLYDSFEFKTSYNEYLKVFLHEWTHFMDHLKAIAKTPHVYDGNIMLKQGGDKSKYVLPQIDYEKYANHHKEVNSRYIEWIFDIINSFSENYHIKRYGFKSAFPNFQKFWQLYKAYAPWDFWNYATVQSQRRIIKRMHQFYSYIYDKGSLVDFDEARKFAIGQLKDNVAQFRNQANFVFDKNAPDFFLRHTKEELAGLYNAFGPSIGIRPDDWSLEDIRNKMLFDDPPKPVKPNAGKSVQVSRPLSRPMSQNPQEPYSDEENETTQDDDADASENDDGFESNDENDSESGSKKAKKEKGKVLKQPLKLKKLHANYIPR